MNALRKKIADAVGSVRISLDPNTLHLAQQGRPLPLPDAERDAVAHAVMPVLEQHCRELTEEVRRLRAQLAALDAEHREYVWASMSLYAMSEQARGSMCALVTEERDRREMVEYTLEHAEIRFGDVAVAYRDGRWECRTGRVVEEFAGLVEALAWARRVVWGDD